jgi:hypothetical protein
VSTADRPKIDYEVRIGLILIADGKNKMSAVSEYTTNNQKCKVMKQAKYPLLYWVRVRTVRFHVTEILL